MSGHPYQMQNHQWHDEQTIERHKQMKHADISTAPQDGRRIEAIVNGKSHHVQWRDHDKMSGPPGWYDDHGRQAYPKKWRPKQ